MTTQPESAMQWQNLLGIDELEAGDVTPFSFNNRQLAIYDTLDGVTVSDARCPHAGANLCDGYFDGKHIECPLHQGLFDARTGAAKAAPAIRPLRMYECRVKNGKVQIKTKINTQIAGKPTRPAPYDRLLDAEVWAFVDATNACYPEDAVDLSIEQQRELYNAMCRQFNQGRPAGVTARDYQIETNGVTVRDYTANHQTNALILYFHGGGFVVGDLDSHDDVCAEICAFTGSRLIACDYRLAPEHPHPAAYQDALALYHWAIEQHKCDIVLVGDSAGATLCAAVAASVAGGPRSAAAQVLIYPYLGAPLDQGSALTHAKAPMLTKEDLEFYNQIRLGPDAGTISLPQQAARLAAPDDFTYAPLWAENFRHLPPSVIFSAECDPLCDDGKRYASAIAKAGGRSHWVEETGLVHGFLRARNQATRAADSFGRILQAISNLQQNLWPY